MRRSPKMHAFMVWLRFRLSANNRRGNNKFPPLDFMIISIIEGGPFAPSEKEEGIRDQRETSHPSCAVQCSGSPRPSIPPKITTAGQFFKFDTNLAEE